MGFNLDNYEPVEARIARFWAEHPEGRIITELVSYTDKQFIVRADIYKTPTDPRPMTTGYAEEVVGSSTVNKTSALENCETSAIGRALANAGYQTDKRPSREEMQKAQRGDDPALAERAAAVFALIMAATTDDELKAVWSQNREVMGFMVQADGVNLPLREHLKHRKNTLEAGVSDE